MRQSKTKLIGLDVSSKIFGSYENAVKEANALKIFITRLIDNANKSGKDYSAIVIIGVSENNSHFGKIALIKNGLRGRPKKVFVSNDNKNSVTNPHLHILIYANPADMIANKISDHLRKKFCRNVCWKKYCDSYSKKSIKYIMKQSKSIRTVKRNKKNHIDLNAFQTQFNEVNEQERIIFTKNEYKNIREKPVVIMALKQLRIKIELICNKPIGFEKQLFQTHKHNSSIIFLLKLYSSLILAP